MIPILWSGPKNLFTEILFMLLILLLIKLPLQTVTEGTTSLPWQTMEALTAVRAVREHPWYASLIDVRELSVSFS